MTQQEFVDKFLEDLCKLTHSEIQMLASPENENKLVPIYDLNGCISKIVALAVFSGLNVPSNFAPAYNRVNADVAFWAEQAKKAEGG